MAKYNELHDIVTALVAEKKSLKKDADKANAVSTAPCASAAVPKPSGGGRNYRPSRNKNTFRRTVTSPSSRC